MKRMANRRWKVWAALALAAVLVTAGWMAQGASPSDVDPRSLAADNAALQQQLASMTPTLLVQAGS